MTRSWNSGASVNWKDVALPVSREHLNASALLADALLKLSTAGSPHPQSATQKTDPLQAESQGHMGTMVWKLHFPHDQGTSHAFSVCFPWYLHACNNPMLWTTDIVYISPSSPIKVCVHYGSKAILHLQPLSGHRCLSFSFPSLEKRSPPLRFVRQ